MSLPSFLSLSREEKIVLALIAIFVLIFFKPVISGDGVGYYAILEGTARDHSFNLSNQLRYNEVYNGTAVFFYEASKQFVSQYPPGMALLSAPFYAVSLVLDDFSIFHVKDEFFLAERGDILIHSLAAVSMPLVLFLLALLFSLEICKKEGLKTRSLAVLLTFFGTPIIRYATYDLYYTHVAEAGLLALLIYCLFYRKPILYSGVLIGLLTLVRYTSALYLIPIAGYLWWKRNRRELPLLFASFVPFLAAAMAYSWLSYGNPFTTGYSASGALAGNFDVIPSGVVNVLFSPQSGLLLWSPLVLLSLFGIWNWRDDRKWLLLGIFATVLWATSAFFNGTTGYSFSNRYYAAMFPVLVIGLALFLDRHAKLLWLACVLSLYNFSLFLLSIAGDFTGIFPSLPAIYNYWFAEGNIARFPQLVIEKTGLYRLIFER